MPRCILLFDLAPLLEAVEHGMLADPGEFPLISCLRIPREEALAKPEAVLQREKRSIDCPLRLQTVVKTQKAIERAEQSGHAVWMTEEIEEEKFRACVNAMLRFYWLPEIPDDMPLSAGSNIKRYIEEVGNKREDRVLVLSSL